MCVFASGVNVAALIAVPCGAQSTQPAGRAWGSFATGFGPASVSKSGDPAFEGSGQVAASLGYARELARRGAAEAELLGGRSFGAGDCVPELSPCAPPFSFVGVSTNFVVSLRGAVGPDRPVASLGPGIYRVAPTESHAVSPRPAVGLQARAELPLVTGARAALAIGVRGLLFPRVHGQSLRIGLLTASLRAW